MLQEITEGNEIWLEDCLLEGDGSAMQYRLKNNKFPKYRLAAFNEFGDQLVLRHEFGYGRTWGPSSLWKKTCLNINFAVNF